MKINTVTVIGANGTMGSLVSGIMASFGNAKVYMVSRSYEKSCEAIEKAVKSVRADSIRPNLIAKTYDDLSHCISESDWIFESAAEDLALKESINDTIAKYRRPGTLVSTGTSGLSIEELKSSFDAEGQSLYFGTHFFNPPYHLPLCEIIPTNVSNQEVLHKLQRYLEDVLLRNTVIVKDSAAFLANRIGFQFLNEALHLAEDNKDQGGIDYIDAIMGPFTGRGLAPLVTVDFVGLDIHKAIVDNLYQNTSDFARESFTLPSFVENLISAGQLGRKAEAGLYKTVRDEQGKRTRMVYDIRESRYRETRTYDFAFSRKLVSVLKTSNYKEYMPILLSDQSKEARICRHLLVKYALYSLVVAHEVGYLHDADTVMAYGFGWIPPLALVELFGGIDGLINIIDREDYLLNALQVDLGLLSKLNIEKSLVDYRSYLKANY